MKKILSLFIAIVSIQGFAQLEKKEVAKKWIVGFGVNFIDNTSSYSNHYLDIKNHWNYLSSLSKVSVERSFSSLFSSEAAFTVNILSKEKIQNGNKITSNVNYIAFDIGGKFYFDEFIIEHSKIDSYVILGAGINCANSNYNETGNLGLGFNFWLKPNIGLRLQTIGKYAADQHIINNNHIQHSAELIFNF